MTIRAIVFDLGHTLWDIRPDAEGRLERAYTDMRALLVQRLGREDVPQAAAIQEAVHAVLREASQAYFMDGDRLDQPPSHTWVDRGCRSLGLELDETLLRELTPPLFSTETGRLYCQEGTFEAVEELAQAGYALGCVTNTLANTAAIREMLRIHGFEEHMDCVVVSADEGWRKPHASLFEKALRELGDAPEESVFVGDSPLHDVAGAKAAGMWAVLTRQYVTRPYEASSPQADAIVSHLRELPDVIARLDALVSSNATVREGG